MKSIFFILTALIGLPLTVQAETVFDPSGSFQLTRVWKVGRESGASGHQQNQIAQTHQTQNGMNCPANTFKFSGECEPCPENHATCTASDFTCKDGYYKSVKNCLPICSGVTCGNGRAPTQSASDPNSCCCP